MMTATKVGILVFVAAVLYGPLYTVDEYSVVSNLISELGAQNTPNNFIMIIAFITLGGGIVYDGVRQFRVSLLPFILFGLAMIVVGLLPHKPLNVSLNFNAMVHSLHGIMASVAGLFITIGFVWQGLLTVGKPRIVCFYMAAVAMVFPLIMLSLPSFQGLTQRLMYLQILGWVWMKYPVMSAEHALRNDISGAASL